MAIKPTKSGFTLSANIANIKKPVNLTIANLKLTTQYCLAKDKKQVVILMQETDMKNFIDLGLILLKHMSLQILSLFQ